MLQLCVGVIAVIIHAVSMTSKNRILIVNIPDIVINKTDSMKSLNIVIPMI